MAKIHDIGTQRWELNLGPAGVANITEKNAFGTVNGTPVNLNQWVSELAAAGQMQGTRQLQGYNVPIVGYVGGTVTLNLDTNGNGKLDYTDTNANGRYDVGEAITEEVSLVYQGYDVVGVRQVNGSAHIDTADQNWKDGPGAATTPVTPPITPPVTQNPNPQYPQYPYPQYPYPQYPNGQITNCFPNGCFPTNYGPPPYGPTWIPQQVLWAMQYTQPQYYANNNYSNWFNNGQYYS